MIYIGTMRVVVNPNNGTFYNFMLQREIINGAICDLSQENLEYLAPNLSLTSREILFAFSWSNAGQTEIMERYFTNNGLIIFECDRGDLIDNVSTRTNERRPTPYKVWATEMIDKGKIRPISADNIYQVVKKSDVPEFINADLPGGRVEVCTKKVSQLDAVLVDMENGLYAGPYQAEMRNSVTFISPQIRLNKHIVWGYDESDLDITSINANNSYETAIWRVAIVKKSASQKQCDVITDKSLVSEFKKSCSGSGLTKDGGITLSGLDELLAHYKNNFFSDVEISEKIREERKKRLESLLTSELTHGEYDSSLADLLCGLLMREENSERFENVIASFAKRPDFFDKILKTRLFRERIAALSDQIEKLEQENADLQKQVYVDNPALINTMAIENKTQELQDIEAKCVSESENLQRLGDERGKLQMELESARNEFNRINQYSDLETALKSAKQKLDSRNDELRKLNDSVDGLLERTKSEMGRVVFDGFVANKVLSAAAKWEHEESDISYNESFSSFQQVDVPSKTPEEVIDYIMRTVQIARPQYSKNTIINIAICVVQGFLTVFAGEPGCGKTSICNIFADVVGLNKIGKMARDFFGHSLARYIPVSVERGWTSKRDFIGYYNPLSKVFDKNNKSIYDALKLLDIEKKHNSSQYPFVILLDEANLSPMEYYWADFMDICDGMSENSSINLGEDNIFNIPDTLRFVATINSDHTTETLSPRLLDRASVITLPISSELACEGVITDDIIEPIKWEDLKRAFIMEENAAGITNETKDLYREILKLLADMKMRVSPRQEKAIKKYCTAASQRMDTDGGYVDTSSLALDYAIAQRILPKVNGNGEEFKAGLTSLKDLCAANYLKISAEILDEIIYRGDKQMYYYRFF